MGINQTLQLKRGKNWSELHYDERWTPENNNKDGLMPRLGGSAPNGAASDFYNQDASYMRLKTASLGYNLPKSILQKVNIQNLRLYVAGTNLFTISGLEKYYIDAEAPSGRSNSYYPLMQTFSFGLNLTL